MFKSLLYRFFAPSVDKVVAVFTKALAALEDVAKHHAAQAEAHGAAIVAATEAKLKAEAEVLRATSVAAKLRELVK